MEPPTISTSLYPSGICPCSPRFMLLGHSERSQPPLLRTLALVDRTSVKQVAEHARRLHGVRTIDHFVVSPRRKHRNDGLRCRSSSRRLGSWGPCALYVTEPQDKDVRIAGDVAPALLFIPS
jgi:hypothetical protein